MEFQPNHKGSCHCGAVQFQLHIPNGIADIWRCSCSMCRMRGAVSGAVPLNDVSITDGEEHLSVYQFKTHTAKHYFCSICGIYTHHQMRSEPDHFGVNLACLEGVNPLELESVPVFDGINHPKDAHEALQRPQLDAVRRLLISNDLPDSDLTEASMAHFLCHGSAAAPEGVIGLELYGEDALLRSLVVMEEARQTGCGTILVNAIERLAIELGVRNLYLLTTTAEHYFARRGYKSIERTEVSDSIRASSEFSSLCPDSAAVMRKSLS